ncbi:stromelysin-2-like [Elgaria multicarinata webbii]|uniref:stromelysin-2-like n=1 Tax=Elgaria multicarinata webbii TaxID=159646 RepID=UPI002FCD1A72
MKRLLLMIVFFGTLPCALLNSLQDRDADAGAPPREWCAARLTFDSVTSLRGEILFFKDRWFIRRNLSNPEIMNISISAFWPTVKYQINAAYEVENLVFFIKGQQYWAFSASIEQPGFPKDIRNLGFPKKLKKIDAALHDRNTMKTYFFSGNKYWRYDETKTSMEKGYPRKIATDFAGIGPKVDAAIQHNGKFYFFSGQEQYEFDIIRKMVTKKMNSNSWLGCP